MVYFQANYKKITKRFATLEEAITYRKNLEDKYHKGFVRNSEIQKNGKGF